MRPRSLSWRLVLRYWVSWHWRQFAISCRRLLYFYVWLSSYSRAGDSFGLLQSGGEHCGSNDFIHCVGWYFDSMDCGICSRRLWRFAFACQWKQLNHGARHSHIQLQFYYYSKVLRSKFWAKRYWQSSRFLRGWTVWSQTLIFIAVCGCLWLYLPSFIWCLVSLVDWIKHPILIICINIGICGAMAYQMDASSDILAILSAHGRYHYTVVWYRALFINVLHVCL